MAEIETQRGRGLYVLVNANAKRGGRRIAVQISRTLPAASVRLTKSERELAQWLEIIKSPRCILAAGGDGTAVALIDALFELVPDDAPLPLVGILPLGTGNGWARSMGAPKLHLCLRNLARATDPLPTRELGVFDCDGKLAHFAGSGWDAMILDDFQKQVAESQRAQVVTKTVYGYVTAAITRTAPRVLIGGNPNVLIENLGDDVFGLDDDGVPVRIASVRRGSILYDGPAGVASVSTCPYFGYGFQAFPFAERMPRMFNVRVFSRDVVRGLRNILSFWRGAHPIRGMRDWFATHVRMTFSRPVPLQIGGDACGLRRTVEYKMLPRSVATLDWRRLV